MLHPRHGPLPHTLAVVRCAMPPAQTTATAFAAAPSGQLRVATLSAERQTLCLRDNY